MAEASAMACRPLILTILMTHQDSEVEEIEEEVMDSATASQTIQSSRLEKLPSWRILKSWPKKVRSSGRDRKWEELSSLLQDNAEMFDAHGHRRKLIIFTEHRDTLNYLLHRIRTLLGKADAVGHSWWAWTRRA